MSAKPCTVLLFDPATGTWKPCGKPEQHNGLCYPGPVCARHRRELARLTAAGLADRVRYTTHPDPAPTPPGAGEDEDAQTALPIPDPAPRPYPWQPTTRPARPTGSAQ